MRNNDIRVDGQEHRCNGGRLPMARRFAFHLRQFDHTWWVT
jgi:hypothetical protein